VAALRKAISQPGAKPDEAVETASKAVYQRILAPVISALPEGTQTLVLSPDSILHGVPFAALLGPGDRFLGECYTVRYVASGRDLLHPPRLISGKKSALLVGDPNFQLPVNLKHATRSPGLSEVGRGMLFSPLPGTASEVSAIKEKLIQQKWGVTLVTREAATEKALVSSPTAALLHVATHGFFLDQGKTTAVLRGSGSSPMARSMANSALVLAGGNTTMRQWAAGSAPPPEDDGILTATEITEMLLDRTELVTLSACDTGLGTMISGQGVAGMKRAFFIAGAHQVLTTLWQVNDEETTRFMIDFYQRVASGEEPGGALSSTQAESLQRLRKSGGLWSAINGAGPFVLTSASRW
jgi:CHAT domain-containing protein